MQSRLNEVYFCQVQYVIFKYGDQYIENLIHCASSDIEGWVCLVSCYTTGQFCKDIISLQLRNFRLVFLC